ncbi:Putative arginyl-tRNA--protein transferase [bacterium HR40]|nr:Putative arginyl-tRNA--protein transferase [bacterium HR40]
MRSLQIPLYRTRLSPCPYLPGQSEARVVAVLDELAPGAFDLLTAAGFRRTQRFVYRPDCPACSACVPVRIAVERFAWSRSFRKVWNRNRDLAVEERPPRATPEQYELFARYLASRHADGGMAKMDFDDYREMVEEAAPDTALVEFRDPSGRLVGATLTDRVADGLSGVYKFFDPDCERRSLGTLIVLWHVVRAFELGLPYVYLGYWIAGCRKMAYKNRFQPLERLAGAQWVAFEPDAESAAGA